MLTFFETNGESYGMWGRWIAVDLAAESSLGVRTFDSTSPEFMTTVDLDSNGIPFEVVVAEEHQPPLPSRLSIPLGKDVSVNVNPDIPLRVRLELSGENVPRNSEWWFLLELRKSGVSDDGVTPTYEVVFEQVTTPVPSVTQRSKGRP